MAQAMRKLESVPDPVRQARIDLAACHRLAHRMGFDDTIYNHFTYMVPGHKDRFLVKSHGLLMSEITASNLIVVDAKGKTLEGDGWVEASALYIHAPVHMNVPNAVCCLHAPPPYATWLTQLEDNEIMMINQDSPRFFERVTYDNRFEGTAVVADEGARLARGFGNKRILMSANHGVTVIAPNAAEAFYDLYYIERVCRWQYLLACSGKTPRLIPDETVRKTAEELNAEFEQGAKLMFEAFKRELDREEPDYKN